MIELFRSGRIVDLILALVLLEAIALVWLRAKRGAGPGLLALGGNLAAGACLLLALRGALAGSDWRQTALWLLAALVAHAFDLYARWRG